jgi:dihydrofolate reductase
MSQLTAVISVSLDGFAAGPNQSMDNPLGEGGERLHEWIFPTASWRGQHGQEGGETGPDNDAAAWFGRGVGAYIMGRNMFGPPEGGEWDESWRGWWGENPPYHVPVFVLTHHAREPLPMEGGTTFHFVTDGIESALEHARAAAGDQDVQVIGGAKAIQQYLRAGQLDELRLHIAPVVLGSGEQLLEDVGDPKLEQVEVLAGVATHVTYRVG